MVIIPFVIGAVLLFIGLPLQAWYTNQPVRTIVTLTGIKALFLARVPAWSEIFLFICLLLVSYSLYRSLRAAAILKKQVADENDVRSKAATVLLGTDEGRSTELLASEIKGPRIHVAWNSGQTFWSFAQVGTERCMQIGGWAHISASETAEDLLITDAYIEGTESRGMLPVKVICGFVRYTQLIAFVSPVIAIPGEPFKGKMVLVDHKTRKHVLEEHRFRFVGSQQQVEEALEAGKQEPANADRSDGMAGAELCFDSVDDFEVRIKRIHFQTTKGVSLVINNNRLDAIHQIRIVISDIQSFDSRHNAFRNGPSPAAITLTQPNVVQPSCSSFPTWLVRKESTMHYLVAGDHNFRQSMVWPQNDAAGTQRWRVTLRVLVMTFARNSSEASVPLSELTKSIVVLWDKATNEFALEGA